MYQGELEVCLGDKSEDCYTVPQGSVISYRADCLHTYRNVSKGITRAAMIINYATHLPRQDAL